METEEMVEEGGPLMQWSHKHHAVVAVLVLIGIFIVLAVGYWLMNRDAAPVEPLIVTDPSATSTDPAAVSTPQKLSITESTKYYDISAKYPSTATLSGQADVDAVAFMRGFQQNAINSFKERGNFANLTAKDIEMQGLDTRKYDLTIDYETYRGARTVSYVFAIHEDTLGAHPNTYYRTFTFDTSTGQPIGLGGLFKPGSGYLDTLSKLARADLPKIMSAGDAGEPDTETIAAGTMPMEDSFQNFAIDGTTLRLIFPPYQVAAYSFGTVVDPVPLSKLKSILRTEYQP